MSRMVYQWNEGVPFSRKVKAQVAGETLEAIRRKSGGTLQPKVVVLASKPRTAPLHRCFEWNDGKAGAMYREEQARNLIRSVRVFEATGPKQKPQEPVRAYVHIDSGGQKAYVTTAQALSDPVLRDQILRRAVAELRGWQERYDGLKELARVYSAIDGAQRRLFDDDGRKAA